ncbi:MAG: NAD(P)H-hydrate epimerase [Planctomycetaceae bacterium]|nr:NAD(P)H-hydrate epimerase [Planctomycetaceae bacterium]MCB9950999.1 NAD(P)H-hydrate epimerase [Planctomycetaceae bacterium]
MSQLTLTRQQIRRVDQIAIDEFRVPGVVLMENAGRGCAELLLQQNPRGPVVICCGKGNNGGDGFVIARHLHLAGIEARLILFADPQSLSGDARTNYEIAVQFGIPITIVDMTYSPEEIAIETKRCLGEADWIVDALLGTGVHGAVTASFAAVINAMNTSPGQRLAVDIPSGLDCDTGEPLGVAIEAQLTMTFFAAKPGLVVPQAKKYVGEFHVLHIGIPVEPVLERL